MQTRVIVNGAKGKMGQITCKTIFDHPDFDLVAQLGRQDDLSEAIRQNRAAIVIDLTRADCVYDNTLAIIASGAHPVIGTSGLSAQQIQDLTQLCNEKKLGGLIVPNFSLGAVLMMHMAQIAARFLPEVEIIEAHHPQKFDAPSGTAVKTANMIAASRSQSKNPLNMNQSTQPARGEVHQDIHIHSLRLPGILAQQQVIFGERGETLSISHNSIDRSCFMPGIILACQHVLRIDSLYYGLEHVLNLANLAQVETTD